LTRILLSHTAKTDRRQRRQERQEAILDAATQLFAERGYANTDTDTLAECLGVGKGTIYRYFSSKRALFLAVVDRVMRLLRGRVDESLAGVAEPLEQVERAVRAFFRFFGEHPEYVELLMQERAQFRDRKKPTFLEHREKYVGKWQALYRQLMGEGRIRAMPVERITNVMSRLLYGTIFLNYFTGGTTDPDEQADDLLDVVFHGILQSGTR
jgi:AcrR family transcriptional regulator